MAEVSTMTKSLSDLVQEARDAFEIVKENFKKLEAEGVNVSIGTVRPGVRRDNFALDPMPVINDYLEDELVFFEQDMADWERRNPGGQQENNGAEVPAIFSHGTKLKDHHVIVADRIERL